MVFLKFMAKKKILIVYYSFSGNNEVLAKKLQARLNCDIYKITETRTRNTFDIFLDIIFRRNPKVQKPYISLNQYDYILLVAPIWAGRIANPVKTFLKMDRSNIHSYSFITLCGGGNNIKVENELSNILDSGPQAILELTVNDLLPLEKRNKVKYTSNFQVKTSDLILFEHSIEAFLKKALIPPAV